MEGRDEPVLFVLWVEVLKEILERTGKFPKRVRFTFSTRIDNLGLDILEGIVEARYARRKAGGLESVNLSLEKLRVLLRICHDLGHLSHKGYDHLSRRIDEAGRMVGGWLKHAGSGAAT